MGLIRKRIENPQPTHSLQSGAQNPDHIPPSPSDHRPESPHGLKPAEVRG